MTETKVTKIVILIKNCDKEGFERLRTSPNVLSLSIENYESEEIFNFERELSEIFI
jgi:hypothetical protein